jgi:hypothetical protein
MRHNGRWFGFEGVLLVLAVEEDDRVEEPRVRPQLNGSVKIR